MKMKLFSFIGSGALILIASASFGQLNVGVGAATHAATTVNAAAVNNAVTRTTHTTTAATNNVVTKVKHVPGKTVTKVKEVTPQPNVNANVGISTASEVSAAENNSSNQSNGNGNSETGTTILTSGQTNATVSGNVSEDKTVNDLHNTKTKVKQGADKAKAKTKAGLSKAKEKVKGANVGVNSSTDVSFETNVKAGK